MRKPPVTIKNLKLIQLMRDMDYHPLKELITLFRSGDLDESQQITVHKELLQYMAPKLKSVDISVSDDMRDTAINIISYSDPKQLPKPIDVN